MQSSKIQIQQNVEFQLYVLSHKAKLIFTVFDSVKSNFKKVSRYMILASIYFIFFTGQL